MSFKDFKLQDFKKSYRRLKRSTRNFTDLIVRDPLDFLDFESTLDKNLKQLIFEIKNNSYCPQGAYLHTSAKSKGINRPTVLLDIQDSLVYRFCIEQIEDELLDEMRRKNIRGGMKIKAVKTPKGGTEYEKWFDDWIKFNEALALGLDAKNYLVVTDVASYYESINLLVLKDLVRSNVIKKEEILNLLFYFLESTNFRHEYRVNTFNGLLQENIDCSRILAYFFLKEHDGRMRSFCKQNNAEYYRFVDDTCILVDSASKARKALKVLTESLRILGLVASIEKTSIFKSKMAKEKLFIKENQRLNEFEKILVSEFKRNNKISNSTKGEIKSYYLKIKSQKKTFRNWNKILKRFYTIFAYAQIDLLLSEIKNHLIEFPSIFTLLKLTKYLVGNEKNKNKISAAMLDIINYLYSEENLYQGLETCLLEAILCLKKEYLSKKAIKKLIKLSDDIFFKKNYRPLSAYARAISCLMYYKFNRIDIDKLAQHYLKSKEDDYILKKYLIFVTLTTSNQKLRNAVLAKAEQEQNLSIKRLVNFVDQINKHKNKSIVKNYIKRNEVYLLYKKDYDCEMTKKFISIRAEILQDLIKIYQ